MLPNALTPKTSAFASRRAARRAFSLLEIIVAIAIIGLLAGLAINSVTGTFENASKDIAKSFVTSSLKLPLTTYRLHMGDYPSTADGLNALATAPQGKADRWRGPYVEGKVPEDPWGRPYQYRYPGQHNKDRYDIWSSGKDGQDGTADDVGNWTTAEEQPGK